jgi:ADP-ribose pyrophosphatase
MTPHDPGHWVEILDEAVDYAFGELFRVVRARLRFRCLDGRMSKPLTRINFERGDAVGVLLYDPRDDAVVLVRQFRYPVYASLDQQEREGDGARRAWILEIVAGVQDAGRSVREVASRELLEEAGYAVRGKLQPIATIYPSPGGTSERIHLFWAKVDHRERVGQGGGAAGGAEETQIVVLPFREAMDRVGRGEINDAKTIIALQYLALLRVWKADHRAFS